MTTKPENPAAFPSLRPLESWDGDNQGMSLRDYFAAAALTGLCSNVELIKTLAKIQTNDRPWSIAYEIADAMLAERVK